MIIKYLNYLHLIIYLSFLYPIFITGKITDNEGSPIMYANIYLKDTFDGTSSDVNGEFIFETYSINNLLNKFYTLLLYFFIINNTMQ